MNTTTHIYRDSKTGTEYRGQWSRFSFDEFGKKSFGGLFYCHDVDDPNYSIVLGEIPKCFELIKTFEYY